MRLTTIHSAVASCVFVSSGSLAVGTTGASSRAPSPSINQDRFGSKVALCAETGEPAIQQGPKKVRGTAVWAGEGVNLRRIRAGLGACDPAWSPDGRRLAVTAAEGLWVFPANSPEGALRVESRSPLGSIEFNYRAFSSPRWSPDGALLGLIVTNGGTSWVEVFEANSGRLFYTSPPAERHLQLDRRARAEARRHRNSSTPTMTHSTVRHAYLDWVRGVAVLIMVEAHVLDAWTQAADRTRPLFGYAMILGGFGAPLFLFLAGVAVVLSAESKFRKTGDFAASWWAVQKRGWQVFGLAFLFRLQSYILSGGYSALSLLKVDILNVMGPAIAMAAMTGRMVRSTVAQGVLFAAVAGADFTADADRPNDAAARLAARPGRVVFPSLTRPHELHALSMGGLRVRGGRRGGRHRTA